MDKEAITCLDKKKEKKKNTAYILVFNTGANSEYSILGWFAFWL